MIHLSEFYKGALATGGLKAVAMALAKLAITTVASCTNARIHIKTVISIMVAGRSSSHARLRLKYRREVGLELAKCMLTTRQV